MRSKPISRAPIYSAFTFNNCLYKAKTDPANAVFTGVTIKNLSPAFDTVNTFRRTFNLRLRDESPAKDKAAAAFNVPVDLDGNARPATLQDIGCYEKQ